MRRLMLAVCHFEVAIKALDCHWQSPFEIVPQSVISNLRRLALLPLTEVYGQISWSLAYVNDV